MSKKSFLVNLDEKLVHELKRRAKRDYLTIQELVNKILWRSARSSLRRKKHPRSPHVSDVMKAFSRYKPYHGVTYYCQVCKRNHKYTSKIGKKHLKYKKK